MITMLQSVRTFFNVRNTLIAIVIGLSLLSVNVKWQDVLRLSLNEKKDELQESVSLVNSKLELQNRQSEVNAFIAIKNDPDGGSWKDAIPNLVSDQKLILRQVRPLGIEQRGKLKEERVFLQVEGDIGGVVGFLHAIGSSEKPVYATQLLITTQSPGSGFITAEFILAKPVF